MLKCWFGAVSVSRADVFDAPLALFRQLVAVGVDVVVVDVVVVVVGVDVVVVVGIDGCTHDDVVACCRRSLIIWIIRSAHIGVCKALRILNLLKYCQVL